MQKKTNYLFDSNPVIDYLEAKLPDSALKKLDKIVDQRVNISVITQIEILGWFNAPKEQIKLLDQVYSRGNYISNDTGNCKTNNFIETRK